MFARHLGENGVRYEVRYEVHRPIQTSGAPAPQFLATADFEVVPDNSKKCAHLTAECGFKSSILLACHIAPT
jgi:hypothetical protein